MDTEIRRVPKAWKHPVDAKNEFIPLPRQDFETVLAKWELNKAMWDQGLKTDFNGNWIPTKGSSHKSFEHWWGPPPLPQGCMPTVVPPGRFGLENRYVLYKLIRPRGPGVPISTGFNTIEGLACWLAETERHKQNAPVSLVDEKIDKGVQDYIKDVARVEGLPLGVPNTGPFAKAGAFQHQITSISDDVFLKLASVQILIKSSWFEGDNQRAVKESVQLAEMLLSELKEERDG